MTDTIRIGVEGEQAATEYLRRAGYLIVERNWRSHPHEIDIVASREGELHFVEVKTRKQGSLTTPEQAITPHKIKNLVAAVNHYVALNDIRAEVRLDLAAVETSESGEFEVRLVPNIDNLNW